ncbi:MAG: sugar phosphorylase [Spirochaetaceae bacterium]|jgi:glycosidase|nr:sugar phosphorylase [Spirochaetaceae bacterium]
MKKHIEELVRFIYGKEQSSSIMESLEHLTRKWTSSLISPEKIYEDSLPLDQQDSVVICYGDNIQSSNISHFASLKKFADKYLQDLVSSIHILPFSPYSSDDGFSVIDYRKVNPQWGDWSEMKALGEHFRLMFDLVLNHCSVKSEWFKKFKEMDPVFKDYFIVQNPDTDLSEVFRPRALPLLHPFDTNEGVKHIWTTFSADQVDLNFSNPRVMLEFLDILFFYISQGAQIIRLDAIGFLWKEIGTSCMHHPKTHAMVQLYRALLERAAPWVVLLTETNVAHKDNISYFGEGDNEAQLVYNFALPPLTLDAFLRGDSSHLKEWLSSMDVPAAQYSYFNFMASHDGIGILAAKDYLNQEEMDNMVNSVLQRGGRISYKNTPSGKIPYEMNINYCDALAEQELQDPLRAQKFLASQSLMIALSGIPGIYIHSLLGSGNWQEGVELLGQNRSINRKKIILKTLEAELKDPSSFRSLVFEGFKRMLKARKSAKAFHPASEQILLESSNQSLVLLRRYKDESTVLVMVNLGDHSITENIALDPLWIEKPQEQWKELINGNLQGISLQGNILKSKIEAWQVLWLKLV